MSSSHQHIKEARNNYNENFNEQIYQEFLDGYTPTEEDLKRVLTDEEIRELCSRTQLRVRMHLWNAVYDYEERLRSEGRLQTKSPKSVRRLLAKAVNRHKEQAVYTQDDIKPALEIEWQQRKKDNILRLDLWAYDRKKSAEKAANKEVQNTSSQIINAQDTPEIIALETELQHLNEGTMVQVANKRNDNEENRILEEFAVINTESFSLDSQALNTEPDEIGIAEEVVQCEVFIPNSVDYEEFNYKIPLTSTQSQELR